MSINVAQIGVGYWGPNLLRNLDRSSQADLKLVVDSSQERRDYITSNYPHIQTGHKLDQILEDKSIDAVVIATPAHTHYEITVACLKANKHVLVEKPMGVSVDQIDTIAKIAEQHNLTAMVGHTFLYNEAVRKLKEIIDSGELGTVRYIYSHRLNLGRIRKDVNALWNLAPHDISILQFLFDNLMPLNVSSHQQAYVQPGISDVAFINLLYPNNIIANIHVSWLDPQKKRTMVVVGENKMAVYDDMAEEKLFIYDKGIDRKAVLGENMDYDQSSEVPFHYRSGEHSPVPMEFREPLSVELDHFFDCILNNTECLSGTDHARAVVEILSIADESAKESI